MDLDKVTGRDRLDFDSLRRAAVTALKHVGFAEHDVAEVVGHEHPRVMFGIYPDRQKLARLKAIVEAIQYNSRFSKGISNLFANPRSIWQFLIP